jgi:hypothetical protein
MTNKMKMDDKKRFELLKKEIEEILTKSPAKTDVLHANSTRKWLLKMKPNADLALQISALAHDIERGLEVIKDIHAKEDFNDYEKVKRIHSEKSANGIVGLMKKYDFNEDIILKVRHLVLNHEFGGDEESNLLMDADSLSFFEENFIQYVEKYGMEKSKKKIKFMYTRMSDKARKLVPKIKFKDKDVRQLFEETISEQ